MKSPDFYYPERKSLNSFEKQIENENLGVNKQNKHEWVIKITDLTLKSMKTDKDWMRGWGQQITKNKQTKQKKKTNMNGQTMHHPFDQRAVPKPKYPERKMTETIENKHRLNEKLGSNKIKSITNSLPYSRARWRWRHHQVTHACESEKPQGTALSDTRAHGEKPHRLECGEVGHHWPCPTLLFPHSYSYHCTPPMPLFLHSNPSFSLSFSLIFSHFLSFSQRSIPYMYTYIYRGVKLFMQRLVSGQCIWVLWRLSTIFVEETKGGRVICISCAPPAHCSSGFPGKCFSCSHSTNLSSGLFVDFHFFYLAPCNLFFN